MGSEVDIALKDVKLPGTTKYKIGDIVKNLMSNKEYKITEINDGKYKLKSNIESELSLNLDIAIVDDNNNYEIVNLPSESKADSKGTEEVAKGADSEGTEAESESTVAESKGTSSSSATPSAFVYVIVQISDAGEISILDKVPDGQVLNTTDPPMDLLTKKTPSTFAIKITREPGCTENCIDGKYKLGLNEIVSGVSENELLSEKFLEDGQESASYTSLSEGSSSISSLSSDEDKKQKFSKILIEMGLATDESIKEISEKYYKENYDEAISKILNDIDSEKPIDAPSGSESSASSVSVIGGEHGPYGLRQVSGTDCFISSVIHLMKDITSYDPNNHVEKCDEITYNSKTYDAKNINMLTNELYKYISGTSENIETYKKSNPEHYIQAYKDLRNILGFKPGFGETTESLNVYSEIANCIKPGMLTVHNLQNEDDMREHGTKSDFENDGVTIKTDFTTYGNTEYLVLNRTVENNDRNIWMAIKFPPEKDGYRLIGKILHPPGHFVYINYSDYRNPVIYDDSIVKIFNITTLNYLFMKEEQLTTSVLYKKDSASASKGGSSRRKQKSKSKKTRRKYFVYNK